MADNSSSARIDLLSHRRAALLAEARKYFAQLADATNPNALKLEIGRLLKRANLGYETLDPSGHSSATAIRHSIDNIVALHNLHDPGDPEPYFPAFMPQTGQVFSSRRVERHLGLKLTLCVATVLAGAGTFIWSEYPETFQAITQAFQSF